MTDWLSNWIDVYKKKDVHLLYSSKNGNHSARHAKRTAQPNMFSLSVKFLMTPESTISTQIPKICTQF